MIEKITYEELLNLRDEKYNKFYSDRGNSNVIMNENEFIFQSLLELINNRLEKIK